MLDTAIWDNPCRKVLDDELAEDRALDAFTLMLFGEITPTAGKRSKKCVLTIAILPALRRVLLRCALHRPIFTKPFAWRWRRPNAAAGNDATLAHSNIFKTSS